MPSTVARITREHVEAFIEDQLARWKPTTASVRFWALQLLFRWLMEEGEINESPMVRMRPPKLAEEPPGVLSDADLKGLLATCSGTSFEDRRDTALFLLLIDTGARVGEVVGVRDEDLNLDQGEVPVSAAIIIRSASSSRSMPSGIQIPSACCSRSRSYDRG